MKNELRQSSCVKPEQGELLVSYGLGLLNSEDLAAFEDHLMVCSFCRAELEAGFPAFSLLREHRVELVEQMRAAGEDSASLLAGMRGAAVPSRRRNSFVPVRWKRLIDAILNPWVYGPLVTATAALILVVHMTGRSPQVHAPVTPPSPPANIQSLHALKDATPASPSTAETPAPAEEDRTEQTPLPATESAPLADRVVVPEQSHAHLEVSSKSMRLSNEPLAARAGSPVAAPTLQAQVPATENTPVPQESSAPSAELLTTAEQIRAPSLPLAARERVLALLANPHSSFDSNTGAQDKIGILSKQPGFKTDPESKSSVRGGRSSLAPESANEHPADSLTWFSRGMSYLQQKQWNLAAEALSMADSLSSERNPLPRFYLALSLLMTGNLHQAQPLLDSLSQRQDSFGKNAAELQRLLKETAQ
jgi:hypothetical protein